MNTKLRYLLPSLLMLGGGLLAQGVDPGTDNLTHSWTFNDGSTIDHVGGLTGTLMEGAEVFESQLLTVATGSWMEMPGDSIAINTYDEFTMEVWFTSVAQGNTTWHMIVYFGDTVGGFGANGFFMTPARQDDKSRAAISCGNESQPWAAETGADGPEYDDGEVHQMVSTINATDITLFIDGQLLATTPLSATNSITNLSTTHAYLARSGYDGDSKWAGQIDEFNIYNKALSADEVLFLFNKGPVTGIEEKTTPIPAAFHLTQNFPNPFNPSTKISFSIPKQSHVSLRVFDMIGSEVATIVDGELPAGDYTRQWNPTNIASGVYFYRLQAGTYSATKKLVFVR